MFGALEFDQVAVGACLGAKNLIVADGAGTACGFQGVGKLGIGFLLKGG
ncbi:MAG: hypothetical protein AAGC58_10025 [Asticcacaulis sp.]